MPIYIYHNKKTDDYIEVIQSMNDEHVYIDKDGFEWDRVYTNPQLNTNGSVDPFNSNQFIEKTGKMKGSYGDMLDYSNELSEKRAKGDGQDPVKEKFYSDYAKERKGKLHPHKMKKTFENSAIKVEV